MQQKTFIGTKAVLATAMTRIEYSEYRGWELLEDEKPLAHEAGFLVEYLDGGQANDSRHAGYISWSPEGVFVKSYQDVNRGMTFGHAVELMKKGFKVARKGWNGKGMYLYLVPAAEYKTVTEVAKVEHGETFEAGAYITMKPAVGPMVIGWLASQTDVLADDWVAVT